MHFLKWLYPGMKFKRWLLLFAAGVMLISLGMAVVFNYKFIDHLEEAIFRTIYLWTGSYNYVFASLVGGAMVIIGVIIIRVVAQVVKIIIDGIQILQMKIE